MSVILSGIDPVLLGSYSTRVSGFASHHSQQHVPVFPISPHIPFSLSVLQGFTHLPPNLLTIILSSLSMKRSSSTEQCCFS